MALLWILILAVSTFVLTITVVVIGQEVHPLAAVILFGAICFGAFKLFQARLTRL